MADDPIAARYAQALFESAKAEGELASALAQLSLIGTLIREQPMLRQFFLNPDVDPDEKVGVLERSLKGAWSGLVRAFVHMAVSMGRAEYLPDIVEALQAMVDAEAGLLRVTVRSAHPLPEPFVERLRKRLEQQQATRVEVRTEIDDTLLGGVQVRLDHRVIDGSVRRQLDELRERLTAVRVS